MAKINAARAALARQLRTLHYVEVSAASRLARAATIGPGEAGMIRAIEKALASAAPGDFVRGYAQRAAAREF